MIGFRLQAIKLGLQTKEVTHPKFYFFDHGVARACAGLIFEEIDSVWKGFAFENYVLNEIRAFNHYMKKSRDLYFYRVTGGPEIDVLIETKKKTLSAPQELLAIEIKYSNKWDRRWSVTLGNFMRSCPKIKKSIGIYSGNEILTQEGSLSFRFKSL